MLNSLIPFIISVALSVLLLHSTLLYLILFISNTCGCSGSWLLCRLCSSCSTQGATAAVVQGLRTCGISVPSQGWNPRPLNCKADSSPPDHQGGPRAASWEPVSSLAGWQVQNHKLPRDPLSQKAESGRSRDSFWGNEDPGEGPLESSHTEKSHEQV